ncbi:neurexin-1 isoform X2 [Ischnura elegans]|uniref:neurexin-1 isoform X2 n=1 Tax=Ischnura elegans TaxID=197161 RepID=UPI001ED8A73F|nr:neurexin-1 isoform X2 [Ischnura elegans]
MERLGGRRGRPPSAGPVTSLALLAASLSLLPALVSGFALEGSQTSFAQFRKWNPGLNGSLEFEFKTESANGLLLYTDDGGTYDFFEVKLVEGALRLRFNLGGGAHILTVGRDLSDGHWHKVRVTRDVERTSLTVDGATRTKVSRGREFHFGSLRTNSDVFVGGVPTAWYGSRLALLALPSVIFEPRFGGSVRNLVYADEETAVARRQEARMKDFKGIRGNASTDACEEHDPCQHGGICISTDSGPICECRNVDFEGVHCEKDKAPSEATFRGSEFLSYDLGLSGGGPIVGAQDAVSLHFKTRQPSGLLFYTGDGQDYMNLALKDGGVTLSVSLGSGRLEMNVKPPRVRFDDNQWHKVTVHRKVQEISSVITFCRVSVVVDGIYSEHSHTAGTFSFLSSSLVYVGGSEDPRSLQGSLRAHANFVGCLRKVEFTADTLKLNLIDLARAGSKLISVAGRPEFMCQEVEAADPVTFTNSDAHLVLPPWDSPHSGSLSLKMRTNEPDGLLLFNGGLPSPMTAPPKDGEFFALELINGQLFAHFDMGSGSVRSKGLAPSRLDDGSWHEVWISRQGKDITLKVDSAAPSHFSSPGNAADLNLDGPMLLGGVGPRPPVYIPPCVWSVSLRKGFVGCIRDVVVNGKVMDIAEFARNQVGASVKPWCRVLSHQCGHPSPCLHGGKCSEGWNRFHCDCANTAYSGPTCAKEAMLLSFNGSQHVTVWPWPEERQSQAEEVALRFRTSRPLGLLVLSSSGPPPSKQSLLSLGDRIEVALAGGRIRLTVRLGKSEKTLQAGHGLNDNQWHTIRFSRRGLLLKLQVDGDSPVTAEMNGEQMTLEMDAIHVGGFMQQEDDSVSMVTPLPPPPAPNFVGLMQQLSINGRSYFDMAKVDKDGHRVKVTARFARRDPWWGEGNPSSPFDEFASRPRAESPPLRHPVTFHSQHTFVVLPTLRAYATADVYFQMKTTQRSGLILYNPGRDGDFLAVELVEGHIHYVFNLGDGPVRVRDSARLPLNDNKWHSVTIGRPSPRRHTLMVDDHFAVVVTGTSLGGTKNLDLDGDLYVGGVPRDKYELLPEQIVSHHGFEGCLASLDLGGETPSLINDAIIKSNHVTPGCDGTGGGPINKCHTNTCENHGSCVPQWNSYECDCDMTSFTGPRCNEESIAYEFGAHGRSGLITYTYPSEHRPETKVDMLAVGFSTTSEDSVLVRVDSAVSHDYLELEIVEGNVFVVYNMGTNDHPIGETSVKVNDNAYHVVRFTRMGANSTLQLDNLPKQSQYPTGHQLTVFNSQASVQIGGRVSRPKQRIERPFSGIIAGLSFNGQHLLELAADLDPNVVVEGDVRKVNPRKRQHHAPGHHHRRRLHPPRHPAPTPEQRRRGGDLLPMLQRMQQTPASGFPGTMDDLVFSGAGSGCNADDEDECTPLFDTGSGDDLITPVYVPPTRPPPTAPPKGSSGGSASGRGGQHQGSAKPCDDEDCFTGSGSGEAVTTEEASPESRGPTAATSESGSTVDGVTTEGGDVDERGSSSPVVPTSPSSPPSSSSPAAASSTPPDTTTSPSSSDYFLHNVSSSSPSPPPSPTSFFPGFPSAPSATTERQQLFPQPPRPPPPPPAPPELYPTWPTRGYNGMGNRISSEAAENTALIIGIIAGAMIAIILIILVILKFKNRTDGSYKVDDGKVYSTGYVATAATGGGGGGSPAVSTALGMPAGAPVNAVGGGAAVGFGNQMNGNVRNGDKMGVGGAAVGAAAGGVVKPQAKRRELKDIKEWYV